MRQASTFLSPLCLSFSLFPSKCPPANGNFRFRTRAVLVEGGSSKLSRQAQHNEERYFVKRSRRHGVDDRTDGDEWSPRKDSADIARGVTRMKNIRDAAHKRTARPLQALPRVSGPSPRVLLFNPFAAAPFLSLSLSLLLFHAFCA
ncbi:hypothetical protein ACS0PU_009471 [Formica fusca]